MKPVTPTPDGPRTVAYAVGILGSFLIVAVLVSLMIRYTAPPPPTEDRNALRRKNLAEMKAAEAEYFKAGYVWQDKAKGFVRVPVERAMALIVQEYQDPAQYRKAMMEKLEKALVKPPEAPSAFE